MKTIYLFLLSAVFQSCAYYNEKTVADTSTITDQSVSWQRLSDEFFGPRCSICHNQGGAGFNSSDYQDVLSAMSKVESEVITRQKMPPDSPLSSYEKTLLTTWIKNGMPFQATGAGTP